MSELLITPTTQTNDEWLESIRSRLKTTGHRQTDDHHLANPALEWNLRPQGAFIREQLIAHGLNRAVHNLIHAECAPVAVPQYNTLQRVARNLTKGLPILEAADDYCFQVEQSNKHPKIKPLEVQLNNLSIEGIRAQLEYVRYGMGRDAA